MSLLPHLPATSTSTRQVTEDDVLEYIYSKLPKYVTMEQFNKAFQTALNKPWDNVRKRMLNIMSEVHYIEKCDRMVNGQYRFVSHDQVAEKLQPLFVKYGVLPESSSKQIAQNGNRTELKVTTKFTNTDDPEDFIEMDTFGYGIDPGDKGPGKAFSYAFKYALLKGFSLATGEDPDRDAKSTHEPLKCVEFDLQLPTMTKKQRKQLEDFLQLCAEGRQVSIEDVKRAAIGDIDSFLGAFHKWQANIKE